MAAAAPLAGGFEVSRSEDSSFSEPISLILDTLKISNPDMYTFIKDQTNPTIKTLSYEDKISVSLDREIPAYKPSTEHSTLFKFTKDSNKLFSPRTDIIEVNANEMLERIDPIISNILKGLKDRVVLAGGCPMKLAMLAASVKSAREGAIPYRGPKFYSSIFSSDIDLFIIDPDDTIESIASVIEMVLRTSKFNNYIVSNFGKVISFTFDMRGHDTTLVKLKKPTYHNLPVIQLIKSDKSTPQGLISAFDFAPAQIAMDYKNVYISTAAIRALQERWFPLSLHSFGMNIYKRLEKYSSLFKIVLPGLPPAKIFEYFKGLPKTTGKAKPANAGGGLCRVISIYYRSDNPHGTVYGFDDSDDSGDEGAGAGAKPAKAAVDIPFILTSYGNFGYGACFTKSFDPHLELSINNESRFFESNMYVRIANTVEESFTSKLDRKAVCDYIERVFKTIRLTDSLLSNTEIFDFYQSVMSKYRELSVDTFTSRSVHLRTAITESSHIDYFIGRKVPIEITTFNRKWISYEDFYAQLLSYKK